MIGSPASARLSSVARSDRPLAFQRVSTTPWGIGRLAALDRLATCWAVRSVSRTVVLQDRQQQRLPDRGERIGDGAATRGRRPDRGVEPRLAALAVRRVRGQPEAMPQRVAAVVGPTGQLPSLAAAALATGVSRY